MQERSFGRLVVSALALVFANAAVAEEATPSPPKSKSKSDKDRVEMVKCYANSCAGAFEYKGKKNSCNAPSDAMEVPKSVCDPKKGLKIVTK